MSGSVTFYGNKWYYGNDYFCYGFKYSWGSWSGNQISLKITATYTQDSHCTGPMYVSVNAKNKSVIYHGQLMGYVCVSSNGSPSLRSGGPSGTVTITTSDLNRDGTVTVKSIVDGTNMGGSRTFTVDIEPPALPVGKPSGRTNVTNITQTTADRSAVVGSYGTNSSGGSWTWTYGPGNYNYNSGGSTNTTLRNLTPGTTYNYKFYIWNKEGKNVTYTGTFTTLPYTPPTAYLSLNSVTNNSITMNYSSSGANVSQMRIYVNGGLWNTISAGNSGTFVVSGLSPKTTYNIQIQLYTPTGSLWSATTGVVQGTTWPNPVAVSGASVSDITPFTAKVSITSTNATDTAYYCFLLCDKNGNALRSEVKQTGSTYTFTGLNEETQYIVKTRVITKTSGATSGYKNVSFETPADQVQLWLKQNNIWRRARMWIKVQGSWLKAKYCYTRVNGEWHQNNNKVG